VPRSTCNVHRSRTRLTPVQHCLERFHSPRPSPQRFVRRPGNGVAFPAGSSASVHRTPARHPRYADALVALTRSPAPLRFTRIHPPFGDRRQRRRHALRRADSSRSVVVSFTMCPPPSRSSAGMARSLRGRTLPGSPTTRWLSRLSFPPLTVFADEEFPGLLTSYRPSDLLKRRYGSRDRRRRLR